MKPTDEQIRAAILRKWESIKPYGAAMAQHCGGRGLAVGCPVCGRRWPS